MKKLNAILLIALIAGIFQACKGKSSSSTDTVATAKDTPKMAATDTTKTVTMVMKADTGDTKFAEKAAGGGMAEVALAKLALQKTDNPAIKKFAKMMVTDHGKANEELAGIAKTKSITLPVNLDAGHQQKLDELNKLSGKDFDKAYTAAMVDGHKKTLALMQAEAENGKDNDLKAFASKVAPTVQMHLDAINKISDSMK